jgi:16S rRNA (uracil1498-N3)-methyltransferase
MARRRFFVPAIHKGAAVVEGDDARHLTRVLRVEAGQRYEISDGANVFLAEVAAARKDWVEFRVIEAVAPAPRGVQITLLASLIKFDHFEWIIEKATELGVAAIVPVITARTEAGLEKAVPKRIERWQRIAMEASQQSRRDDLPAVRGAMVFASALRFEAGKRYWLDEDPGGVGLMKALPEDSVALLIGPEGGWTDAERAAASQHGWTRVWLGPRILRAETAAIAALAVIQSP